MWTSRFGKTSAHAIEGHTYLHRKSLTSVLTRDSFHDADLKKSSITQTVLILTLDKKTDKMCDIYLYFTP